MLRCVMCRTIKTQREGGGQYIVRYRDFRGIEGKKQAQTQLWQQYAGTTTLDRVKRGLPFISEFVSTASWGFGLVPFRPREASDIGQPVVGDRSGQLFASAAGSSPA